jgi:hypothetical protein
MYMYLQSAAARQQVPTLHCIKPSISASLRCGQKIILRSSSRQKTMDDFCNLMPYERGLPQLVIFVVVLDSQRIRSMWCVNFAESKNADKIIARYRTLQQQIVNFSTICTTVNMFKVET